MRKLMWYSIGFAIACSFCGYSLPAAWFVPLAAAALLLGVVCIFCEKSRFVTLLCLGILTGLAWFWLYYQNYLMPAYLLDGKEIPCSITVTDYGYDTARGTAADGTIMLEAKSYLVRFYTNDREVLNPGDVVTGTFRFRYTSYEGQEPATYHPGQGIFLLGYQQGSIQKSITTELRPEHYPAVLARRIKDTLRKLLPGDVFPFAQALLLGDSSELSYETDTALKISGIRHIVAVSGLHVTILFSLISAVTFHRKYLTAVLGIPILLLFAAVAGFTPSVSRACIMVVLMLLAQACNQQYDSPTALAFAALVLLVINPLVITNVGFQLTVGCVAGIQLFSEPVRNWLSGYLGQTKGKSLKAVLKRGLASSISVSLSAMSLTTPLCAVYFGTVSLIGILTNLITLWIVNFIFYGLIAICLLYIASTAGAAFLAQLVAWPIRFVLETARMLSRFPLAAVYTCSIYIVIWLFFAYILFLAFLVTKKHRVLPGVCCAVIGLCIALMLSWVEPLLAECQVTMLNVGQGQSILLQSAGYSYLIDCGGDSDTEAADAAAEMLLSSGISRLDGIILTHCDRDHAGGLEYLLARVETDTVFYPCTSEAPTVPCNLLPVGDDMELTVGSAKLTIFGPLFVEDDNENSLCVLFESENCDILITGDRGSMGEMLLLQHAQLPELELLVAGHHGSKRSSTDALLSQTLPETVFISAGRDNPYGHPAPELLERLEKYGCSVHRTDIEGTLRFRR